MSMKKLHAFCEVVVILLNKSVVDQVALRQGSPFPPPPLFSIIPPPLGIYFNVLVQAGVGTPKTYIYAVSDIGERQTDRQTFQLFFFERLTQCVSLYEDKSVCVGAVWSDCYDVRTLARRTTAISCPWSHPVRKSRICISEFCKQTNKISVSLDRAPKQKHAVLLLRLDRVQQVHHFVYVS
jgi:hypothetical protein